MEGSDRRRWWRGAIAGGGPGGRSLEEGRGLWRRAAISGRGERSRVEGSSLWWRGAIAGGGEHLLVEGIGLRWRGAIAFSAEMERYRMAGSGLRRRGASDS